MRGWLPSSGASELKSVKRDEQRCDVSFIANKKMEPLCMGCHSGNMYVLVLYKCIGPFCSLYGLLAYVLVYLYCFVSFVFGHFALVLTEMVSYAFHI